MSTQCIFLLVRSFIDPTFCGLLVYGLLQFKCQFNHCFKLQVVERVDIFANPVFKNTGINKVITFTFTTSTPLRSSNIQGSRLSRRVGKIVMIIRSVFEINKEK